MDKIKIGIFSPNDFRPWVRADNLELMIRHENLLREALQSRGWDTVTGGEKMAPEDRIAWNTGLVRKHIEHLVTRGVEMLIINEGSWTFPYDSRDAVQLFTHLKRRQNTAFAPKVIVFAYKNTEVPGLVAGMAVGGALRRIGIPYHLVYGPIDRDSQTRENLTGLLEFYQKRVAVSGRIAEAIRKLPYQKYVAFGGMSLKMCTTTTDVDTWTRLFGISYEALDQSELKRKALSYVEWEGSPGTSACRVKDQRLSQALTYLKSRARFDYSRDKFQNERKFIYQLSFYYAAIDLLKEYDGTFLGIKCQDELSAYDCTACLATSFLSNDFGPDGQTKPVIPCACENDMDSSLTQLMLSLVNDGKPAGFGDFRDVEDNLLAIVNCGQHPPSFFGQENDTIEKKLSATEFLGQEVFYQAGGAAVRGRTGGNQVMTVARLARENFRYYLAATTLNTVEVAHKEHERYNFSWPIIRGRVPISGQELINLWPCNHLGFTYGDVTPELVELAAQLDIGYRIYDRQGRLHEKAS